jgi:uncharacterized protein (DUF885 family)
MGLQQVALLREEAKTLAKKMFGDEDLNAAFAKLSKPPYTFKSREEIIAVSRAAADRARAAMPKWFGILPKADVVIRAAEAFRERSSTGSYVPASVDGSRPGTFVITTYDPETRSRAGAESTAFHETIPGHHLQMTIALENTASAHPLARATFNSGFAEGWALYAERLSDEMGLFTSDVDRMGMLSQQLVRASRLVVDSGIHARGWTRDQGIAFLTENTVLPHSEIETEVDRYAAWPGQATSYMLGMLEIRALRDESAKALGDKFDLRAFHDRVLEDGAMPLWALREKIERWMRAK